MAFPRYSFWESNNTYLGKITGSLPAAPEISELYKYWQFLFRSLPTIEFMSRIEIDAGVTNVSEVSLMIYANTIRQN